MVGVMPFAAPEALSSAAGQGPAAEQPVLGLAGLARAYGARIAVQVSSWSGWLSAADGAWATWAGETAFIADWRGNYRIDFRIEWWDQSNLLAWQVRRITDYYYFDEWNTAWGGPFPSCMRQPV